MTIEEAGRILARAASSPARVYVFGSRARGDAAAGSDFDFLVVERDLESRRREGARLRMALPPLGAPVDVLVFSEAEADACQGSELHVLGRALREGRLLARS